MRTIRNLSGIYFRLQNKETGKWENICFEDLSESDQDKVMETKSDVWLKSLAKNLANTINRIGYQFDLMGE